MDTGRKILNLRKDLGVPQKVLAEQTAVTASALSRIESGMHQPRGPIALRIARQLGVTVDYLLDDTAPYPPPAREVIANLAAESDGGDEPVERMPTTAREQRLLHAFRQLDAERRVLLEAALNAPRDEARFAAYLLGAGEGLPGVDDAELARFAERAAAASRS